MAHTLHQVWVENPSTPMEVWIAHVYVTAVSGNGCRAGAACQIFVQQQETFADLASAAQQSLKLFISANTAFHFVGVAPGDQVDVDAFAWRYNVSGQNELLLEVNLQLPGCAKVIGQGIPQPVAASLTDFSVAAYENTLGPVLVRVTGVSGRPALPSETFGLWPTGVYVDGGLAGVTSISPYFIMGGAFSGLTQTHITDFTTVTGVFGLYAPTASPGTKYEELYVRSMVDMPIGLVH